MIRFGEGIRLPDVARVCDNIISAIKERLDYAGSDSLRSSRYNDRFLFACHIWKFPLLCFHNVSSNLPSIPGNANSSNSVKAGIPALCPIVRWFVPLYR
jgi:hypothetical protein